MKANELRIGNWYDHNGIPKQATPNTIEEVWESERSWCKPIPLTEEWLLKFGFEKEKENYSWYFKGKVIINVFNDVAYKLNTGGCTRYEPFKHVHQLQNLYFALTGEELTIKKL